MGAVDIPIRYGKALIDDLIGDVSDLVTPGSLNEGQGNALIVKLEAAKKQLDKEKDKAAVNQLKAFINQVTAFVNAGILLLEEGQPLIDDAQDIIDSINVAAAPALNPRSKLTTTWGSV